MGDAAVVEERVGGEENSGEAAGGFGCFGGEGEGG